MGTTRTTLSNWLAAPLERRQRRRIREGRPFSIPLSLWLAVPTHARSWLVFRVFRRSERWLDQHLEADRYLGTLNLSERTSWSLSSDSLVFLAKLLRAHRPEFILEFGSGASTVVHAQYAAQRDPGGGRRVFSLEHDGEWLERTRRSLESNQLARYVELIHAPLGAVDGTPGGPLGYCLGADAKERLHEAPGFDLCLIDGPPGEIGRHANLPFAAPYLRQGAVVLLDDGYRDGEQSIWRRWLADHPLLVRRRLLLTASGLLKAEWNA